MSDGIPIEQAVFNVNLTGCVACVTGASSWLGRHAATALAKAGAQWCVSLGAPDSYKPGVRERSVKRMAWSLICLTVRPSWAWSMQSPGLLVHRTYW